MQSRQARKKKLRPNAGKYIAYPDSGKLINEGLNQNMGQRIEIILMGISEIIGIGDECFPPIFRQTISASTQ